LIKSENSLRRGFRLKKKLQIIEGKKSAKDWLVNFYSDNKHQNKKLVLELEDLPTSKFFLVLPKFKLNKIILRYADITNYLIRDNTSSKVINHLKKHLNG
jgi:hypothetical protein